MKKLVFALLFVVCGCQGVLLPQKDGGEQAMYVLSPVEDFNNLKQKRTHLLIDVPKSSAGLETKRIALLDNTREMSYYAGAKWANDLPDMVHSSLVSSFENTQKVVVSDEVSSISNGYKLIVRIRDFQAEYDENMGRESKPNVVVKLICTLVKHDKIIKTFMAEHTETAKKNSLTEVVAGFDLVFEKAQRDVIREVFASMK